MNMLEHSLVAPLLSGSFAFIGVVLAQFVIVWLQKRRTFDEDARRWQMDRRILYARLLSESNRMDILISTAVEDDNPYDLPNFHEDHFGIEGIVHEIVLIGSDEVVVAARNLDNKIYDRLRITWGYAVDTPEISLRYMTTQKQDQLSREHRAAYIEFLYAARNELASPGRAKVTTNFNPFPDYRDIRNSRFELDDTD